jgi:hypothetical protein
MTDDCAFVATASKQIVHEIAAPLFARHLVTGELHACGTASLIGRGYAITAAHVIDDFLQKFGAKRDEYGNNQSNFDLLLYLTLNEGVDLLPLKVLKLWSGTMTDIAVLFLGMPADWPEEEHTWKIPRLQLLPPPVGDRISGFGFSEPEITWPNGDVPTIDIKPRTTTGQVVEVHDQRRDSLRLPFPCFRVNARFDGSMSGGPVFSSAGNLCGIVCSSLPADNDHNEHVSYVTTLWPMLGFLIEQEGSSHTLSEYFDGGHFFAVDRDKVHVNHEHGQAPTVSIRAHR